MTPKCVTGLTIRRRWVRRRVTWRRHAPTRWTANLTLKFVLLYGVPMEKLTELTPADVSPELMRWYRC